MSSSWTGDGEPRRGPAVSVATETADLTRLSDIRAEWKGLGGRALEPNVFYDPDFALPLIGVLGHAESIRALLVWHQGAGNGRLLTGLFPYIERRRWAVPIRVAEAFIHPFAMSSAPLVDGERAADTVRAFLGWLDIGPTAPAAWLARFLPKDGALYALINDEARLSGAALHAFGTQGRAVLDAGRVDAGYLRDALSAKSRKEYGRARRRLTDHGVLTQTRATMPAEIEAAMAEFLTLEASGWKGRGGTAAASLPATTRMFEEIARGLAVHDQMRLDALRLDGAPVAMTVSCGEGRDWWLWKIAYDEAYARYSPGVLLVLGLTEAAIAAGGGERVDSCALPGHPMIERIWRQRRPYTDLLLAPSRLGGFGQGAAIRLETLRRGAEAAVRKALRLAGR